MLKLSYIDFISFPSRGKMMMMMIVGVCSVNGRIYGDENERAEPTAAVRGNRTRWITNPTPHCLHYECHPHRVGERVNGVILTVDLLCLFKTCNRLPSCKVILLKKNEYMHRICCVTMKIFLAIISCSNCFISPPNVCISNTWLVPGITGGYNARWCQRAL